MTLNVDSVGWHVFLASLFLLLLLPKFSSSPRGHLNLRIFLLGICLAGYALYLTSYLVIAVATAVAVWAPKPLFEWRLRHQASISDRPPNPFKPVAKVCVPCGPAGATPR